ncbi:MAG: adenylate kinase [Gemmatimonadota bacterium]|nr:adenylate kinase [Gemmatimonadota bacterium]
MHVVLLGPPGVGKGTQGILLADAFGWERIVTGDLLRAARDAGTELGREAQQYMARGELVHDQLIIGIVQEKLKALTLGTNVVFDGFPRNSSQALTFSMMLQTVGLAIDQVVVLEADDDVLIKRISGRRSCPSCGAVYNQSLASPIREGVCDTDGGALFRRADDEPSTVRNRLEVYRRETEPLIAYYEKSHALVHHIAGGPSVEVVQTALRDALGLSLS